MYTKNIQFFDMRQGGVRGNFPLLGSDEGMVKRECGVNIRNNGAV